jgi:hypothetical protein
VRRAVVVEARDQAGDAVRAATGGLGVPGVDFVQQVWTIFLKIDLMKLWLSEHWQILHKNSQCIAFQ